MSCFPAFVVSKKIGLCYTKKQETIEKSGFDKEATEMDARTIKTILEIGETIAVEFKRCGNKIENDVYESVCSFLNRFGGLTKSDFKKSGN